MCPPTDFDGQTKWERRFQKEDQKVGRAGWTLGRDGCKPVLQTRQESPEGNKGLAGTQSLGTSEWSLQPESPAAFPLLGSGWGNRRALCSPQGEGLAPGGVPGPEEASPEHRKPPQTEPYSGVQGFSSPSPCPEQTPHSYPALPLSSTPVFKRSQGKKGYFSNM